MQPEYENELKRQLLVLSLAIATWKSSSMSNVVSVLLVDVPKIDTIPNQSRALMAMYSKTVEKRTLKNGPVKIFLQTWQIDREQ